MPEFILHIGYSKTGTTAIQNFLSSNRQNLLQEGILYPDISCNDAWINTPDHNLVGRSLAGHKGWMNMNLSDYFNQFFDQIKVHNPEKVILSGETFMGSIEPWNYDSTDSYQTALHEAINRLSTMLKNNNIRILVYLRRQDEWMESIINQNIKVSALLPEPIKSADIKKTIDLYSPRLNYYSALEPWSNTFGDENIIIGVYEKSKDGQFDIIEDFCSKTAINSKNKVLPVWSDESKNSSFDRNMIEIKKLLNRSPRKKYQERTLIEFLRKISNEVPDSDKCYAPLLDYDARVELMTEYSNSNQELASRYLDRTELFEQAMPEVKHYEEYNGLNPESVIHFMLRYDNYKFSSIYLLRLARHWLAEKARNYAPSLHAKFRNLLHKTAFFKR